ncbi:uncharacterized protein LOC143320850 isoform X1 [Chaetodon auriga]|uniref:uncharacterized protein LOC143320850 isoform X1 n=1 Tax=Chaetodon auriga TaxID=39042 RepID=UPI0040328F82
MMSSRQVEYLSHHHLPQLLESLLTGLLYHHPEDPISFLQSCLISTKQLGGPEAVAWDTFILLEKHQLSPGALTTISVPPRPISILPIQSLPPIKPQTPQTLSCIPPTTPSITPRTTLIPSTTPLIPQITAPHPLIPLISPKIPLVPTITPPVPPLKFHIPQTAPPISQITSPIPHLTPSIPPKTTSITPIKPQITTSIPQIAETSPLTPRTEAIITQQDQTTPLMSPAFTVAQLTHSEPQFSSIKPKTFAESKVPAPAPPGPAVTPPAVHTVREERTTKIFSTKAPPPGLPPSPVLSQLSIDSDSDMTEISGLLQEVSIPPRQRPRPLIVFIIGGPGSGKGSQAARLARCFSFSIVSLDELLRQQLLSHASPSRKWGIISEMMGHGQLGPQEETISELRQQLSGQQEVSGFIVDGFPRDIHQALSFQEQIGSPDLVMLLLCSNETLRCRLQRRATHLGLLGDNSHALRRRLETFQRDIVSISRYYRQLHLLTQVDADRDEETVFADLSSVIREKLLLKDSDPADFPECSSAARSVTRTVSCTNQGSV